jgi:hypothetical protein
LFALARFVVHPSVVLGGGKELVGVATMLEKRHVGAVVVPMVEHVLPESHEGRVVRDGSVLVAHKSSSRDRRRVTSK